MGNDKRFDEVYSERKKKREKIVIHNIDGTTEEYKTGILFTLEEIYSEVENQKGLRLTGKHCNTLEMQEAYVYGLSQIVMAMLEDEKIKREMFYE